MVVDVMGQMLGNVVKALVGFGTTALSTIAGMLRTVLMLGFKAIKFITGKLMKSMKFIWEKIKFARKFSFDILKLAKFLKAIAMFIPIITMVTGIILIATDGFFYVILIIAWLGMAMIKVVYELLSFEPFIYLVFFFYFLITVIIPFLVISVLWLALLLFITIICLGVSAANVMTKGALAKLVLCQNSPTSWYTIPSYQHGNKYSRGLFCSKPCRKGYLPEGDDGKRCGRLPKGVPSYCPQSQVMRFYTGLGSKDGSFAFSDYRVKGNTKYLTKEVHEREEMLLGHFVEKVKHHDRCKDINNPNGMRRYDTVTKNICANLDILKSTLPPKDYARLSMVCNEAFCSSRSSYPFCSNMTQVNDYNTAELIKRIVCALAMILMFTVIYTVTIQHLYA